MAAIGLLLLLLLGPAVVAPEQFVAQETVDLQPPSIEQHEVVDPKQQQIVAQVSVDLQHAGTEQQEVWQKEQDPSLPPDTQAAGATLAPRPAWPAVLVDFPPAWPEAAAVTSHCHQPPRYPSIPPLPASGFAHLRRQAAALEAFRPRLDACCSHRGALSCARRAWTEVLDAFCADEFGVKTRQFHCCRHLGDARRRCFARSSAAVAVGATAAAATKAVAPLASSWEATKRLPFPPGEPTASNMGNICKLRGLRPGPGGARGSSGPRDRMRLRLEREFGRCCRNQSLSCAQEAWRKGLERFCREESSVKTRQHQCCQRGGGRARSRCFAAAAPYPGYDRELHNVSLARPGPAMLRTLCGPTVLISKRKPVPELLGALTTSCCSLPPEEQSNCAQDQLSQGIATLCASVGKGWRDPEDCCSWGDPERRRCFEITYLAQVTLGAAVDPPHPDHEE
ncbi:LOW QUALITY PROTEIN: extracellular matrix protein 1 [Dryobates pubescens]|uniref:LOW QUALITY PROTEIN: extracellular matrix protein 1 n=1 Tax=Dryobates pubescens TaxID=118200 RepID=UPI0023B9333B|nr:LOW QUALITY PROTEIN: extracellular matrix protein 1 [Dryobates pubescens]